jgi:hypothetical protein
VERRVFPLMSSKERAVILIMLLLYGLFGGFMVSVFWWDRGMRIAWGVWLLIMLAFQWRRYYAGASRRLEVSDEGCRVIWWPRHVISIGWSAVCSVTQVPWYAFFNPTGVACVRVRGAVGRGFLIPRDCAHYEDIMDIIRQHAPADAVRVG